MKRLIIEGHHVKKGYIVSFDLVSGPPVRFYKKDLRKLPAIIERWNRRFGCTEEELKYWAYRDNTNRA